MKKGIANLDMMIPLGCEDLLEQFSPFNLLLCWPYGSEDDTDSMDTQMNKIHDMIKLGVKYKVKIEVEEVG